jgi:hypothetical protein
MYNHTSEDEIERFDSVQHARRMFRDRVLGRTGRYEGLLLSPTMEIFLDDPRGGNFRSRRPDMIFEWSGQKMSVRYPNEEF